MITPEPEDLGWMTWRPQKLKTCCGFCVLTTVTTAGRTWATACTTAELVSSLSCVVGCCTTGEATTGVSTETTVWRARDTAYQAAAPPPTAPPTVPTMRLNST